MTSDSFSGDDFDLLADSFVARLRRGEKPSPQEYAERHPVLAEKILDLFPALVDIEKVKDRSGSDTNTFIPNAAPSAAVLPDRLGDYRIIRLIGYGGMGVVYEAEREKLRSNVALKVLHERCRVDSHYAAMFLDEARNAARLHHTNIVTVFDFGEHEGILYYAMQYIPGQSLDHVLQDVRRLRRQLPGAPNNGDPGQAATLAAALQTGVFEHESSSDFEFSPVRTNERDVPPGTTPWGDTKRTATETLDHKPASGLEEASSPTFSGTMTGPDHRYHREVARIGAQVADALAYAHDRGVLHRDIKPANLMLDDRGTVWVTDFGLAKFDERGNISHSGDVVGTLRYMAPERFDGRSNRRSDIYALGVTLYEMLALRPAFDARNQPKLIRQVLDGTPPPLRTLDPRISLDLSTVIHKAMARDPADRFATAAEMASELRCIVAGRPIKSRSISAHERYWRWCKRNPVVSGLSAAAAMLTIAIAIISTAAAIWYKRTNTIVEQQVTDLDKSKKQETKQLELARVALWDAKLATARASRYSGRSGQRFDALAALAEAAKLSKQLGYQPERFDKLRNEAIAALALPDMKITKEFGRWTDDLVSVDVNEDFDLYSITDTQGRCIIRRVEDDAEVAQLPPTKPTRRASFGPGRWLADQDIPGTGTLTIWDLSGQTPVVRIEEKRPVHGWDFRPDGRLLAVLRADGSLTTYDLPSGQQRFQLPPRSIHQETIVRLHPTAPFAAFTSYFSQAVEVIHLETGKSLAVKPPWSSGRSYLGDWSPDGHTLAIPGMNEVGGKIALYEFVTDPPTLRLLRTMDVVDGYSTLAFNEAGDRLFGRGWGGFNFMYDLNTGRKLSATKGFTFLHDWSKRAIKTDKRRQRLFPGLVDDPVRRFGYWSVAEGREYRLLTPKSPPGGAQFTSVSADGRMAVCNSGMRVIFYDVFLGREVASLPLDPAVGGCYAGIDESGYLLTNTLDGCYRWPIRPDGDVPDTIVIGPPKPLSLYPTTNMTASSRDGKVIAQAKMIGSTSDNQAGGWLLHRDKPDLPHNLVPGVAIGFASFSPDGKWVAFGGSPGSVFVYEVETEKQVFSLAGPHGGLARFSPDGKWVATDWDGGRLYSVGTWKPGPQLGHGAVQCFSADGKTAVLCTFEGYLRLVEVATGREIARLEGPDQHSGSVAMSADGATIVATCADGLRVWDLRLIRAELAKIGLDWDAPPFPPEKKPEVPLKVRIVGADLLDPNSALSKANRLISPLSAESPPERSMGVADELIRTGWHNLGLAAYDAIIRHHPKLPHLRMHRSLELFRRGKWEAVAEDLRIAFADELHCGFRGQARTRLAWAYHELGRNSEAASVLENELKTPSVPREAIEQAALRLLLAEFLELDGKADRAKAERDAAAALHPNLADAANHAAWGWIVLRADQALGDNERQVPAALLLARKATELAPEEPMYQNTYGIALFRSGRYAEAKATLEANLVLGKGTEDAWDLFPLAMCQHRLGDRKAARESYDKAVAWATAHAGNVVGEARELSDLQAEVGRLVGAK